MFLLDYKIIYIYIYNFKGDNQTHENKLIFQKKKELFSSKYFRPNENK